MAFKAVLALCASALFVQTVSAVCGCGNGLGLGIGGLGYAGLAGNGLGYAGLGGIGAGCGGVASTGGGLPVASASAIPPVGVSVLSENAYEGALTVGGNLPFLGTVGFDGVLPTAGAGAVSYGCGNGAAAIGAEGPIGTGIISGQNFAPSIGTLGAGIGAYGAGIGNIGYGAGIAGYGAGIGLGYGLGNGCGCGCGIY